MNLLAYGKRDLDYLRMLETLTQSAITQKAEKYL